MILETPLVRVGLFEARPEDPHFSDSGLPGEHLIAFPLTSVRLEMECSRPFVADRNLVVFYNPDQQYRREVTSLQGDRAHWLGLEPEVIEQMLADSGQSPLGTGDLRFPFLIGPSDTQSYELQHRLIRDLVGSTPPTHLEVEERVLEIFRRTIDLAGEGADWDALRKSGLDSWSEVARELLAAHYDENWSVQDLASAMGCSAYHLCRVFRRDTGLTLHGYRERLRLRRALLELRDRRGDLTGLALDLGYSSHSHFTAAFRKMFGRPPSQWNRRPSGG